MVLRLVRHCGWQTFLFLWKAHFPGSSVQEEEPTASAGVCTGGAERTPRGCEIVPLPPAAGRTPEAGEMGISKRCPHPRVPCAISPTAIMRTQPKCAGMNERIKKTWSVHTRGYESA